MLIRSEFDIQFHLPQELTMVAMLRLHPSVDPLVREPEELTLEHIETCPQGLESKSLIAAEEYLDSFGNRCSRFVAPQGMLRVSGRSLVEDDGQPDPIFTEAIQHPVEELPPETLQFLLSSRYCEVDQMSQVAGDMFGHTTPGWARVVWIRDWVHNHVRFDYNTARPTKTCSGCVYGARWRVPRLPASGDCDDSGHEYSCALCDGLPWGHPHAL